jgi:hypothetical protein
MEPHSQPFEDLELVVHKENALHDASAVKSR